jgi:hypothetical protein
MSILVEIIEKIPYPNNIAFGGMVHELDDSDYEFLEDHFRSGAQLPSNIIKNIDRAFKRAGYLSYTWDNYHVDVRGKVFDRWLEEI